MKTPVFLILLLSLCYNGSVIAQKKMTHGPAPAWVEAVDFTTENKEGGPYVFLLLDNQENAILQEDYYHYVIQLNNADGVQEKSTLSIDYDPSYQEVLFHDIFIHRKGEKEKREVDNFKFLQRETDLNRALYDGAISAVKELEDIRQGDIIEYSYTIKGYNPLYGSHTFSYFYQEFSTYIHKINQSLITDREVFFKYHAEAKPAVITKGDNIRKYSWKYNEIPAGFSDSNVPSYVQQSKKVTVSSMKNWNEVVDWSQSLYKISDQERQEIKSFARKEFSSGRQEKDIVDAIRFVQDEVRYLGFEEGIKAFKPHRPTEVLKRRFGDCKDKSFLLSSILTELGIDATPMYVHSSRGRALAESLPSPIRFDHCVATFNYKGQDYFVDPTISNQGGNLENLNFPDYGHGLPLRKNNSKLIKLTQSKAPKIVVDETLELDSVGGGGLYKIESRYTGREADILRSYVSSNSRSEIKNDYRNYYANAYPDIEIDDLEVIDTARHDKNEIIIKEVYSIDKIWEEDDTHFILNFYSFELEGYLSLDPQKKKGLPYYLGSRKKYIRTFTAILPEEWGLNLDALDLSNKNFDYTYTVKYDAPNLVFKNRYFLKESIIAAEDVKSTLSDADKIFDHLGYELTYKKSALGISSLDINWGTMLLRLIGVLVCTIFAFWAFSHLSPSEERKFGNNR